jgi:DNA polymerase-3 subunit epsilon
VFCALFGRLCANAATIGDAVALLRGRSRREKHTPARARRGARPHMSALPHDPGVYVFRDADGRVLYVGKSVDLRTRASAHFTAGAAWTEEAEHVDHQATESELGALLLEERLIKTLRPPGNVRGKAEPDGFVYLRCRLDIAFPILEVAREPAAGHAVCVGPLRGRAAAAELVEQLNSLFGLRHCGRTLPRRAHPSAYGQMGRCLSPCLHDLDPNVYRERLDSALALFTGGGDGGAGLLAHVDAQMREASAARRYERAAWLQRRRARLESLLGRLGGVLRAIHASTRLVLAPHPSARGRFDAVWIAGGRVVDWAPAAPLVPVGELTARSSRALAAAGGGWLTPEAVAEARLVGAWVAAHSPPALELCAGVGEREHVAFLAAAGAG